MLPKKNRADKKLIDSIFKEGKFINSPLFMFKYLTSGQSRTGRVSFIVPKSLVKLAVKRNQLRRKGYNSLTGQQLYEHPGLVGAFIFKKIPDAKIILSEEIEKILTKIN